MLIRVSRGKRSRRRPREVEPEESPVAAPEPAPGPQPKQLLALLAVVAALVAVLAAFSLIEKGCGEAAPTAPDGYAAIVHGLNGRKAKISNARFERALRQNLSDKGRGAPQPGTAAYEDVQASVLAGLLVAIWKREEGKHPDKPTHSGPLAYVTKWRERTLCAPEFLSLKGSGDAGGAGFSIEEHCKGATNGKGAFDRTLQEARQSEEGNDGLLEQVEKYGR